MSGELTCLDHLVIVVGDLDEATEDYTKILARAPSWRGGHPSEGTANSLFRLDNTYVELIAPVADGGHAALLRARLDSDGEGPIALAFGSPDVDAFRAALMARGVEATESAPGHGEDSRTGAVRRWRSSWLPGEATRGVPIFVITHEEGELPVVEPGADAVHAVDHVVVMTGDVEASRAVYGDNLGLRLALDREFGERGVRLLFFRVGGLTVEIGGRIGEVATEADASDHFWGVAYKVADVDATHARLQRAGVDVTDTRAGHKKGTRVCTVKDGTHGVPTLLIGPADSDA